MKLTTALFGIFFSITVTVPATHLWAETKVEVDFGDSPPSHRLPTRLPEKRVPSSLYKGFKSTNSECTAFISPDLGAKKLFNIPSNKKLWVESFDSYWIKVFHKTGVGFVAGTCFE